MPSKYFVRQVILYAAASLTTMHPKPRILLHDMHPHICIHRCRQTGVIHAHQLPSPHIHPHHHKGVSLTKHTSRAAGSSSALILLKMWSSASFRYSGGSGAAVAGCEYDRVHDGAGARWNLACRDSGRCMLCVFAADVERRRGVGRGVCGRASAEVMRRKMRALEGAMVMVCGAVEIEDGVNV
jgi:hypothetical protein